MKTIQISSDTKSNAMQYYGWCPLHNWAGMYRDNNAEAQADLDGHIGYFPDESHVGARVVSVYSSELLNGIMLQDNVLNFDDKEKMFAAKEVDLNLQKALATDWIYRVNKRTDRWVVTVQYPTLIRVFTRVSYIEYDLQPDTQELIIDRGQCCEMWYNNMWSFMIDADHR